MFPAKDLCAKLVAEAARLSLAVQNSEAEGAILFGSRANATQDIYSDIDLLIVSPSGPSHRHIGQLQGVPLDAEIVWSRDLLASLTSRKWRDNSHLLALCTGHILFDRYGLAQDLKKQALALWTTGPEELSIRTRAGCRQVLLKIRATARRLYGRAPTSFHGTADLLDAQIRVVYQELLYLASRLAGEWAFPSWVIAKHLNGTFYCNLKAQHEAFLALDSSRERAHAAELFASGLLVACDTPATERDSYQISFVGVDAGKAATRDTSFTDSCITLSFP